MSPAALHQRMSELYVDTQTGDAHSAQVTGLFHQLVKLTRIEARQAECAHVPGESFTETHLGGRDRVVACTRCGKTLTCEPV